MKMSVQGRRLLEAREGVRLNSYLDSQGVRTIGVGHTAAAGPPIPTRGMTLTHAEVDDILSCDLVRYEAIVNRNVKVSLADHEFDALVSICFNVESALSPASTIVKRLNAGDCKGAAAAIMLYRKPPEIIGRRTGEQRQFLTPYQPEATS